MPNDVQREVGLRIKLSSDMSVRLNKVAELFGMPSATFAAFAIADFVNRYESTQANSQMAFMNIGRSVAESMSLNSDDLEKIFTPAFAELTKQKQFGIDSEDIKGKKK